MTDNRITELEMRLGILERQNLRLMERVLVLESSAKTEDLPDNNFQGDFLGEYFNETVDSNTEKFTAIPASETAQSTVTDNFNQHKEHETKSDGKRDDKPTGEIISPKSTVAKPKVTDKLAAELMEARIGGTWLNRIGIVAFVFGLGFFLKYSFDNNWIGPTGRVIIGILTGLCFLGGGEYGQRKGYRVFAQGLTGGGIASLYFSIFAAFSFYHLIGQTTAFGIMILITTTAVLLSVYHNAYAVALLGIIGGFLTPFFLSTGQPNQVGLFSYIVLLDCGILALAYFKNWRSINLISFVSTLLILMVWAGSPYSRSPIWTNQIFYTIFFTIFACLAIFYNVAHRLRLKNDDLILITGNAAAFFILSYFNLKPLYSQYIGILPFLMAVIYFIEGYFAWLRNKEDSFLVISLWGVAVVFLTLTMPVQLQGRWITVAWAAEAVVLFWLGCINKSFINRMAGLAVMGIALLRLSGDSAVFTYYRDEKLFWPVINIYMLPFLACIAGAFLISYMYRRKVQDTDIREKNLRLWFSVLGFGLTAVYLNLETIYFCLNWGSRLFGKGFPAGDTQTLTIAIIWFAEAIVLIWYGLRNDSLKVQFVALLSFFIGLVLLLGPGSNAYLYSDIRYWPLLNLRTVPYIFGIVTALFISRKLIVRDNLGELKYLPIAASVVANIVAMTYLSLEVIGFYRGWGEQLGFDLNVNNAIQMTLSVIWTLYAIGLMTAGFIQKNRYLRLMSIIILAVTILKVFLFDLANLDTIYRIVSFIVLGGLLLVVSFLYQKYRDRIFGETASQEKEEA